MFVFLEHLQFLFPFEILFIMWYRTCLVRYCTVFYLDKRWAQMTVYQMVLFDGVYFYHLEDNK